MRHQLGIRGKGLSGAIAEGTDRKSEKRIRDIEIERNLET